MQAAANEGLVIESWEVEGKAGTKVSSFQAQQPKWRSEELDSAELPSSLSTPSLRCQSL